MNVVAIIVGVLLALVVLAGFTVLAMRRVREELAAELQRRRLQSAVLQATARLRRLEHGTVRQMHDSADEDFGFGSDR